MSNPLAQLQEATIKAHCKVLRMPMMAAQFGTLADQAIREKKSHVGCAPTRMRSCGNLLVPS